VKIRLKKISAGKNKKFPVRGLLAALCGFVFLAAGAQAGPLEKLNALAELAGNPAAGEAQVPDSPAPQTPGLCIFNARNGAPAGAAALNAAALDSAVIGVGEAHDQANDHLAQLEALKALYAAKGTDVAVGFEMLNLTLQPVLDDYASGKITEDEFLQKSDWQKEWGFSFALYKPLFDFIRANKLRALALNLPHKVVSSIARAGLDGLTPEQRQYLPAGLQVTTDERYIGYVKQSFNGQMAAMFKFENYLAAMSAWNETMGARLAEFIKANPAFSALTVAGSGHIIYNAGIPASVKARLPGARVTSFYMQGSPACPSALAAGDAALADYVWYVGHSEK
jgi:uncharacterized iron-regulated protein